MFKRFLSIILSLFLSACQAVTSTPHKPNKSDSPIQNALDKHLAQWQKADIHNYSYVFQRSCFCMRDYTKAVLITVDNDVVVDAKFADSKGNLPDQLKINRQPISYLFDKIQDAIDRKAHSINVKYNEQFGYPTSISIDYDQQIADEELYLRASDFKAE